MTKASITNISLIILRGRKNGFLFREARDFQFFKSVLMKAEERLPIKMIGFVILNNCVKIAVQMNSEEMFYLLISYLEKYHMAYAMSVNRNVEDVLFKKIRRRTLTRARHNSQIREAIECEPVRRGMVDFSSQYPYSSVELPVLEEEEKNISITTVPKFIRRVLCALYCELF